MSGTPDYNWKKIVCEFCAVTVLQRTNMFKNVCIIPPNEIEYEIMPLLRRLLVPIISNNNNTNVRLLGLIGKWPWSL